MYESSKVSSLLIIVFVCSACAEWHSHGSHGRTCEREPGMRLDAFYTISEGEGDIEFRMKNFGDNQPHSIPLVGWYLIDEVASGDHPVRAPTVYSFRCISTR